jgi:hypothetical protein
VLQGFFVKWHKTPRMPRAAYGAPSSRRMKGAFPCIRKIIQTFFHLGVDKRPGFEYNVFVAFEKHQLNTR